MHCNGNSARECFLKCGHPQVLLCGLGLLLKNLNRDKPMLFYYLKNTITKIFV